MKSLVILAAGALLAAPAIAQAPAPPAGAEAPMKGKRAGGERMFATVSPEGRALLLDAMRAGRSEDRGELRAARDRINALVAADRLDVPALEQAMADERRLVNAQHERRQAAMLAAFAKMSAEDRRAFAADARLGRARAEARAAEWRKRAEDRRERRGGGARAPAADPAPDLS
jgi:hypothetical protein